jgi:hypothetical protein
MQSNVQQLYIRGMLSVLFALFFIRVIAFSAHFGSSSLQMDFSAFYTAGESLNKGLSPYSNHITRSEPIWDGVDTFTHSRFLYPPLVANSFQPIAALPYHYAKQLWMLISLVSLFFSLLVSFRLIFADQDLADNFVIQCAVAIFTCLYYPLLTFLERGQIDSITLLLLVFGISKMIRDQPSLWSGILFAIATLLKLHVVFIVPFLILQKQWMAVAGYITGCILISILTLALNGSTLPINYIFEQLPRISTYGEGGTDTMKVPPQVVQKALSGVPTGSTLKDGGIYQPSDFEFSSNATLVRTKIGASIRSIGASFRINISMTVVSALCFSLFFAIVAICGNGYETQPQPQGWPSQFGYWLMVLVIILLCAPLTWVMNTIWLLPAVVLFIYRYLELRSTMAGASVIVLFLCVGTTGLLIASVPDQTGFQMLLPAIEQWAVHKYVVAEFLVFAGLFGHWVYECRRRAGQSSRVIATEAP